MTAEVGAGDAAGGAASSGVGLGDNVRWTLEAATDVDVGNGGVATDGFPQPAITSETVSGSRYCLRTSLRYRSPLRPHCGRNPTTASTHHGVRRRFRGGYGLATIPATYAWMEATFGIEIQPRLPANPTNVV